MHAYIYIYIHIYIYIYKYVYINTYIIRPVMWRFKRRWLNGIGKYRTRVVAAQTAISRTDLQAVWEASRYALCFGDQ